METARRKKNLFTFDTQSLSIFSTGSQDSGGISFIEKLLFTTALVFYKDVLIMFQAFSNTAPMRLKGASFLFHSKSLNLQIISVKTRQHCLKPG